MISPRKYHATMWGADGVSPASRNNGAQPRATAVMATSAARLLAARYSIDAERITSMASPRLESRRLNVNHNTTRTATRASPWAGRGFGSERSASSQAVPLAKPRTRNRSDCRWSCGGGEWSQSKGTQRLQSSPEAETCV